MSLIIHSLWVDEVSSPSSKVVPAPRLWTRGAKAEERNMMAKSGGKGGVEIIGEREARRGSKKRKRAQVTSWTWPSGMHAPPRPWGKWLPRGAPAPKIFKN